MALVNKVTGMRTPNSYTGKLCEKNYRIMDTVYISKEGYKDLKHIAVSRGLDPRFLFYSIAELVRFSDTKETRDDYLETSTRYKSATGEIWDRILVVKLGPRKNLQVVSPRKRVPLTTINAREILQVLAGGEISE